MSPDTATRRNAILERALSMDRTELAGFLDGACAGDATLRRAAAGAFIGLSTCR
jgi:hypothetical protein